MMILKRFGKRIQQLRKQQGISQEDLAFKSGLHRTYIGGIELGKRNLSLNNIARLAKALKISLSKLFEDLK